MRPVGLWAPAWLWQQEGERLGEAVAELDECGFGAIWIGNGPTMLDLAAPALGASASLTVATGIVNIWAHPVDVTARRHRELAAAHPGRFLLGLGNGPREAGQWARQPYATLVSYLDALDAAGVAVGQRAIAAVGPRMLALAGARSRGAHPFLTTPDHTLEARRRLGPAALLAPEQKVVLERDTAAARAVARQALAFYLPKRGYATNLRRLGFTADDLDHGGSDRLVDALVARGDVEAVRRRVEEHLAAGADHVAVQVLTETTDHPERGRRRLPREQYRILAAALTDVTGGS